MTSKIYLAIAFLIVAALLAGFLVWPKYQNLGELRAEIDLRQVELQSKSEYFSHIRDVSQQLADYEEQLTKIASALPDDLSLPATFNFLQKTAAQSGLILEGVTLGSIGAYAQLDNVKVINLNISLAGSYDAFKNFLFEMEKSARIVEIKSITLTPPGEDEGLFSFRINVAVHSY